MSKNKLMNGFHIKIKKRKMSDFKNKKWWCSDYASKKRKTSPCSGDLI